MSTETNEIVYPKPHRFHPRFDHLLAPPFTHIHPFDVLRSVAGEKEIPGPVDNELIAHFHEHVLNLGQHSDENKYHDEVPYCSSALNWAADMSGCRKTNSALASSWNQYNNQRSTDWIQIGDIVCLNIGNQNHVTLCNKRFNRKTDSIFEGFGANQGNMIKVSVFRVSSIKSVQMWDTLPKTILAPIGYLGQKPVPKYFQENESTR